MMDKKVRGSALVMVMIYVLVLITLGTAALSVAVSEYRMGMTYSNVVKAYYLAEAGMEKAVYEITEMEAIVPYALANKKWEMGKEDLDLVEPGMQGGFTVAVTDVGLNDEIFVGEGEDIELYKSIYEINLKSTAVYRGAPAGLEAGILVEDYEEMGVENKVQVEYWRQIRGVEDED